MTHTATTPYVFTEHDLQNLSYFIYTLSTYVGKVGFPIGPIGSDQGSCQVVIEHKDSPDPFMNCPVWDTVYIDGVSYGNRHGGIQEFIRRVAEAHHLQLRPVKKT